MSSYIHSEISFPSADGKSTVIAQIFAPKSGEIRGIVQLSHGMVDHVGRYRLLAEYLTARGFIFAGNDHLGHGKTAGSADDFGYFAEREEECEGYEPHRPCGRGIERAPKKLEKRYCRYDKQYQSDSGEYRIRALLDEERKIAYRSDERRYYR